MKVKSKSLPRIFIESDSPLAINDKLELENSHRKHLGTVLRLKSGYLLEVVDKSNQKVFLAEVIDNTALEIILKERLESPTAPKHKITLLMAVCKADKNELIIEKCTELGVEKFIFFEARHSIAKLSENKVRRLDRAAESAAEQSKQSSIPSITYLSTNIYQELNQKLPKDNTVSKLICSLEAGSISLSKATDKLTLGTKIIITVGPEGDFSDEEYQFFKSQNFQSVNLGNSTLRSETAAIASCAKILL